MRQQRKRSARAFVRGYGAACDAYHLTAPHPDGVGLKQALAEAMATAGISREDLAFINAHGTGTPDNDRVESRVLDAVLPGVPFLSTKGCTGHTLGAAGGIEAGMELHVNCEVGKDIAFEEIANSHDAIFVGVGATKAKRAGINGENAPNVFASMQYLTAIQRKNFSNNFV